MNARIAKKVARHRNRYSEEQERLARRKLRRKPLWSPRLARAEERYAMLTGSAVEEAPLLRMSR